jgi:NitT/TauT family transport system permease protein
MMTDILSTGTQARQNGARRVVVKLAFFLLLVAAWEALFRAGVWPPYLFPSPSGVARTLVRGFGNQTFLVGIAVSMRRLLVGFVVSAVLGTLLGLALGRVRLLDETLGSLVLGLQALPSICWLPLALLWFGLSEQAILFIVVMGALLSITLSTQAGVKNSDPLFLRAALNLGARGWRLYLLVVLPAALPAIISGMKLGWSFAWRSLMAAELLYVSFGLGQLLMMGRELNDMNQVVAVMLVIIAIGLVVDRLVFAPLETRVRARWGLGE